MLYIKSLFGNIFVLVLENFDLKGNCHGGTFMLDETQISLCIEKLYYYEKNTFIPFHKYDNSNRIKLMYPCLT